MCLSKFQADQLPVQSSPNPRRMTEEEAGGSYSCATDAFDSSLTQATGASAWLSKQVGVKCATVEGCQSLATWEGFRDAEDGCLAEHERLARRITGHTKDVLRRFHRDCLPGRCSERGWRGVCLGGFRKRQGQPPPEAGGGPCLPHHSSCSCAPNSKRTSRAEQEVQRNGSDTLAVNLTLLLPCCWGRGVSISCAILGSEGFCASLGARIS